MTDGRPSAAIVGRGLPELGGIPTFLDRLVRGLRMDGRYDPHLVNLVDESARHHAGSLTLLNLRRAFRDAAAVWRGTRGVDVMHANCSTSPLTYVRAVLFCVVAKLRGSAAVLHLHMSEVCEWGSTRWGGLLLRASALVCDAFCTVSEEIAVAVAGHVRKPVRYIQNAVPVGDYAGRVAAADGDLRFVFVGVFSQRKGLDVLLEALRGMDDRSGYTFRLVGGDPPEGRAEADLLRDAYAAASLPRVTIEEEIPAHDVPDLLRHSDVLVLPSRAEGLPMVVLEAMAAGLAVISTTVGHTSEAVDDGVTGLLVPPDDPAALRHALCSLLDNRDEVERLGGAAQDVARARFDLPRLGADVADVFDLVTGRRR